MRKLVLLIGALAAVLVTGLGTALANHSGAELRTYGRGEVPQGQFDFSARLGPREATDLFGEPHGTMKWSTAGRTLTAEVTCLEVVGNQATIAGNVTQFRGDNGGPLGGTRSMIFYVTDNTAPSGQQISADRFVAVLSLQSAPQLCPPPGLGQQPITSGNIVVEEN